MKRYIEMRIEHSNIVENNMINIIRAIRSYTGFELRDAKRLAEELKVRLYIRMEVEEPRLVDVTSYGASICRKVGVQVKVMSEEYLEDIKRMMREALECDDFAEVIRLSEIALSFDIL